MILLLSRARSAAAVALLLLWAVFWIPPLVTEAQQEPSPIAIELEGRYHDIAKFFELVSKLPRIVNMGSIAMTVSADNEFETRVKVKGTATTFRFVGNG